MTREATLHRATANALWLPLRRALVDGWPVVTDWYVNDPTGQGRTSGYVTASGLPSPTPKLEAINDVGLIIGIPALDALVLLVILGLDIKRAMDRWWGW